MRALLAVLLCAAGRADDVCFDTGRGVTDAATRTSTVGNLSLLPPSTKFKAGGADARMAANSMEFDRVTDPTIFAISSQIVFNRDSAVKALEELLGTNPAVPIVSSFEWISDDAGPTHEHRIRFHGTPPVSAKKAPSDNTGARGDSLPRIP